jgi:L-alanine-DL-glutamate epimerase-like enolase superfamily enzyme
MKADFFPIDLTLNRDFVIAGSQAHTKRNYILSIDGIGLGEGSGSIKYGPSPENIEQGLQKVVRAIADLPDSFELDISELLSLDICPPAQCALSTAFLDRAAKMAGKSLHDQLSLAPPNNLKTSVTISVGDSTVINSWHAAGYDILKLKMDDDIKLCREAVELIRQYPKVKFRIDANGSWNYELAAAVTGMLPSDQVEMIEQPFPPEAAADWRRLRTITSIPLFMDESIGTPADIEGVAEFVDGVNIKIQKSGRLETAIAAMTAAHRRGLKVMLGCMIESSIGIAAAYHISSLADYIDLDGCLLVEDHFFSGLRYDHGKIEIANRCGHGIAKK